METHIEVSPEILNWILTGARPGSLPGHVVAALHAWARREKTPTFGEIEEMSRATGVPPGYFFLETPPKEDLSFVTWRAVDSPLLEKPSRELIDVVYHMKDIREWMHGHLVLDGYSGPDYVGSFAGDVPVEELARRAREELGLEPDWCARSRSVADSFGTLRKAVSAAWTVVMSGASAGEDLSRRLDIREFRALTLVDAHAPLVFLNANDTPEGMLFALAHGFAHVCAGENSLMNDRCGTVPPRRHAESADRDGRFETEALCRKVALELLVPRSLLVPEWTERVRGHAPRRIPARGSGDASDGPVLRLASLFHCGPSVVAGQAYACGLLSREAARGIVLCSNTGHADHSADLPSEGGSADEPGVAVGGRDRLAAAAEGIDRRFLLMLAGSVGEGRTFWTDACRLAGTDGRTFSELVSRAERGEL